MFVVDDYACIFIVSAPGWHGYIFEEWTLIQAEDTGFIQWGCFVKPLEKLTQFDHQTLIKYHSSPDVDGYLGVKDKSDISQAIKKVNAEILRDSDRQAFPISPILTSHGVWCDGESGLTKRELFALVMQRAIVSGAVARGCPAHEWPDTRSAIECADVLLANLGELK